jgi:O-antigen/teichoic acid export membrane protein
VNAFIKSSCIFFIGNVSSKLVILLLLPIYTKYISPREFGIYDLTIAYINLAIPLVTCSIWIAIMRFMFDDHANNHKSIAVANGTGIFFVSVCAYSLIFLICTSINQIQYAIYVYLYGLCFALTQLYSYISRGFQYNLAYALSGMVATVATVASNIILIVIFQMDYKALYISWCIGSVFQIVILESKVSILKTFSLKHMDFGMTKRMVKYAFPYCLNTISWWLLTGYNKVVIVQKLDAAQNGLYAIAAKFGIALQLIASCIALAWQETAFLKSATDKEVGNYYNKASNLYLRVLLFGTVLIMPLISIFFPLLIDSSYEQAKLLIPLNVIAIGASIFAQFQGTIFGAIMKTRTIFYSSFAACLVNVILINLMILPYGVQAANISMLSGFIVSIIIRTRGLQNYMGYRISYMNASFIFIPLMIVSTAMFAYANWNINLLWVMSLTGCIIYLYRFKLASIFSKLVPL